MRDVSGRHMDVPYGNALLIADRLRAAQATGRPGGLLCLLDQPAAVVELSWPYKKVSRAKRGTLFSLEIRED